MNLLSVSMSQMILKSFLVFFLVLLFIYLLIPTRDFPIPPPDSVQSQEDADIESSLRRAYFTDFTRQEVMEYYQKQMSRREILALPVFAYRLNYPPEDAYSLIRDQTRSTFLEEIVVPFRESLFVNGFEPKLAKDEIWYKGRHFRQKITVKYVPGFAAIRLGIVVPSLLIGFILLKEWSHAIKKFKN